MKHWEWVFFIVVWAVMIKAEKFAMPRVVNTKKRGAILDEVL